MKTITDKLPDLRDRSSSSNRSKWSVIVDEAMKTARKRVSRAELLTNREQGNCPPVETAPV